MMRYDFNADEIFEMAEQMERNGENFYKNAAATIDDEAHKKLLLELAAMEVDHEKTFKAMRSDLKAAEKSATVFDPEGEAALYLRALVDTRVFFRKKGRRFLDGENFKSRHRSGKRFYRFLPRHEKCCTGEIRSG